MFYKKKVSNAVLVKGFRKLKSDWKHNARF